MGKIIIEFDSVEEAQDARLALDGYKWKMAMWDLDMKLRETTKYDNSILGGEASEIECVVAEKYRDIIREILDDYSLNLED